MEVLSPKMSAGSACSALTVVLVRLRVLCVLVVSRYNYAMATPDELMRRYQDLSKRASDLRSYL